MANISNSKSNTLITGTDSADWIYNSGNSVTIAAKGGNDTVKSTGEYVSINAGEGKDTIIFDDSELAGTQYHAWVSVAGGNNYIKNPVELSTIVTGDGADTIIAGGGTGTRGYTDGYGVEDYSRYIIGYTSIMAGAGNNRITVNSYMKEGSITAGDGNDVISIASAENSSINIGNGRNTLIAVNVLHIKGNTFLAGNGSDLVRMSGSDNLIGVGSGRNRVSLTGGQNNTIISGAGNDTLDNRGVKVTILGGDGKDIIYGFDNTDILQISGTFSGTYDKSKKEVYFKIGSTANALTLKSFTATTFNVNGDSYKISGSTLKK